MPNLMEIAFGSVEQARQDIHDSEMRTIHLNHENKRLAANNNALERSLNTFDKLKAQFDLLNDSYDYVVADRNATRRVLKELRTAAGISADQIKSRVEAERATILTEQGLPHLINR